jgi:DNA-binding transcriptional LysR family regulator
VDSVNERDCIVLITTYEEKNFTKAAELLYITQPALTYRIQQLENEFGVRITLKNGKSIYFTPEGEYLVKYARRVLIDLRKTKDYLLNMSGEIHGTLRIGVYNSFACYKLPPIIKEFKKGYPKIEIYVITGESPEIYQLLQSEDIQVGIIKGDYKWIEQKHMISEESVCLISKYEIDIDMLPKLPQVQHKIHKFTNTDKRYKMDPSMAEIISSWWTEKFSEPPLITMNVDSVETCKQMVKNGLGYAFVPQICLEPTDELNTQVLVLKTGEIKRKTWLLYKNLFKESPEINQFVNYIKSIIINDEMY